MQETQNGNSSEEEKNKQPFGKFKLPGDIVLDSLINLYKRNKPVRVFDYFVGISVLIFIVIVIIALVGSM